MKPKPLRGYYRYYWWGTLTPFWPDFHVFRWKLNDFVPPVVDRMKEKVLRFEKDIFSCIPIRF